MAEVRTTWVVDGVEEGLAVGAGRVGSPVELVVTGEGECLEGAVPVGEES
jgi:hypothetical protein